MNYKNQRQVYFPKEEITAMYNSPKTENFLHSLDWDKLILVTSDLNGNEFKVWLYCMKWSGKDKFFYSPATLDKEFNISESTAQRAFKTLVDKGYLEAKGDNITDFIFHPLPMQSK